MMVLPTSCAFDVHFWIEVRLYRRNRMTKSAAKTKPVGRDQNKADATQAMPQGPCFAGTRDDDCGFSSVSRRESRHTFVFNERQKLSGRRFYVGQQDPTRTPVSAVVVFTYLIYLFFTLLCPFYHTLIERRLNGHSFELFRIKTFK